MSEDTQDPREPAGATPAGATPAGATPTAAKAPVDPARRRRRLLFGGLAAAAVLLLVLGCLTAAAIVRSGARLADRAGDDERRSDRLGEACLELETRLNRLAPPASTGGEPRRRATAVRNENAALRPLLAELDEMTDGRRHREDRRRVDWAAGWRRLVEARTAYADGLDRQAAGGEPAFFVAPQADGEESVVEALEERGPVECSGSLRRLARPDL